MDRPVLKRHAPIIVGLIVVGGGGFGYYYWIQMLQASQVEVRVAQAKPSPCTDVSAPLFVALLNRSPRTVTQVRYRLIAQHPGQTTNLVEADEIRQRNDIAKPHRGFGYCQKVALLTERFVSWQFGRGDGQVAAARAQINCPPAPAPSPHEP